MYFLTILLLKLIYFSKKYITREKIYKQNKAHYISPVTGSPQNTKYQAKLWPTVPLPEQETAQRA
jgi:hypothetical protein